MKTTVEALKACVAAMLQSQRVGCTDHLDCADDVGAFWYDAIRDAEAVISHPLTDEHRAYMRAEISKHAIPGYPAGHWAFGPSVLALLDALDDADRSKPFARSGKDVLTEWQRDHARAQLRIAIRALKSIRRVLANDIGVFLGLDASAILAQRVARATLEALGAS